MDIIKSFDGRTRFFAAIIALALVLIVPMLAMAAQVTERSIALSSSSVSAENVSYQVKFTPDANAAAFVLEFCKNTPLIGQACTPPVDFDATAAASNSNGVTAVAGETNKVTVTAGLTAATEADVTLTGIDNPSEAGPLYARVVTYETALEAGAYESEDLGEGVVDQGSIAVNITPTIGVSGAVLETMTFCVAGAAITENCGAVTSQTLDAPVLRLGETTGSVVALSADDVSEGSIYTQISTNAANGAIINLKSTALDCGGLVRAGAPTSCDILPALNGDVLPGEAKFGVRTAAATDTGTNANGTLQPVEGSVYNDTNFRLNYVAGNGTGITSIFGDPFLDTDGAPVNNKNMAITFGVSVDNNTPAGLYSTDLRLIATGKF